MSRVSGRMVAGAFTLIAGIGAWVIGKKAGEKVAKATEMATPPPAPPVAEGSPAPHEDGE